MARVNQAYRRVRPVHPAAAYIGGKKQLARRLVAMIAAVPHETYAEPFIGMGGVFLLRERAPKCEVINDIFGDVATHDRHQVRCQADRDAAGGAGLTRHPEEASKAILPVGAWGRRVEKGKHR